MRYMKNPFILAIIGGIVVGVAIAMNLMFSDDDVINTNIAETTQQQTVESIQQQTVESIQQQTSQNTTEPESDFLTGTTNTNSITESSSEQSSLSTSESASPDEQETTTNQQEVPAFTKPNFDVVRITANGHAVIAGRAEPEATVEILLDNKLFGTATADKNGEWVFVPSMPIDPGTHDLSLRATTLNGFTTRSEQVVVINVPERDAPDSDKSFAVALSSNASEPVQILQKPGDVTTSLLSIDAIDYNDEGEFSISGTAKANSMVNIYLDNTYIGTSQATENGQWHIQPETRVKSGQYELRADQVDDKGAVIERITMPFVRDEVKPGINPDSYYVVQPGNSLWRIARRAYGEGLQYTIIFIANSDQIRDADLIYPGQIFSLPQPD